MAGKIRTAQFDDVLHVLSKTLGTAGPYVEDFKQVPQLNGDVAVDANLTWEMQGTNAASLTSCVHSTGGGVKLLTAGADNDQVILVPHADAQQSVLNTIDFSTDDQPYFGAVIETDASVATLLIDFGLVLTAALDETTDANQVKITYNTDTSDANFQANVSITGADTEVDLGSDAAVAANTAYTLAIRIDEDRKAHFYVNGKELYVSAALTSGIDLVPVIGIQSLSAAADTVYVRKLVVGKLEATN